MSVSPYVPVLCQILRGEPFSIKEDEWASVFELAERQGVTSLLWPRVRESPLPTSWQQTFETHYLSRVARHVVLSEAVRRILTALESTSVEYLVLKGWVTAGSSSARPMADLDLLVRDLPAAQAAIRSVSLPSGFDIDWHRYPTNTGDLPVRQRVCQIPLEAWWQRSIRREIAGVSARTLDPLDHLVAVMIDFTISHGTGRLLLLHEITEQLPRDRWDLFLARIREARAERIALFTLWLAHRLLEATVPQEIFDALGARGLSGLDRRFLANLASGALFTQARYALVPLCLPTWTDRAAFAWGLLWPQAEWFDLRGLPRGWPGRWRHWRTCARDVPRVLRHSFGGVPSEPMERSATRFH